MVTVQTLSERDSTRASPMQPLQQPWLRTAILCLMVFLSTGCLYTTEAAESIASTSAAREMEQGSVFFRQGSFAQAALRWTEAARIYEQNGQVREQSQALLNLAYALQREGQTKKAVVTLEVACELAVGRDAWVKDGCLESVLRKRKERERLGDPPRTAMILGRLGNAFLALDREAEAQRYLDEAVTIAKEEQKSMLVAVLQNDRANVLAAQDLRKEAIGAYMESNQLAKTAGHMELAVTAAD